MLLAGKMMKKMGERVRYSGNELYYRYIRNLLIFGLFAITDRSYLQISQAQRSWLSRKFIIYQTRIQYPHRFVCLMVMRCNTVKGYAAG